MIIYVREGSVTSILSRPTDSISSYGATPGVDTPGPLRLPSTSPASNWSLTLRLNLCLHFCNQQDAANGIITDANGSGFAVVDWSMGEISRFRQRLVVESIRFWNERFWLQPRSYSGLDWPPQQLSYRPNVLCFFRIELLTPGDSARQNVLVWRVSDTEGSRPFRSDVRTWCHTDLDLIRGRVVAIHEIGHLLGLPHPGQYIFRVPGCDTGGESICYSGVTPEGIHNVMGEGTALQPWNGEPWLQAITLHTNTTLNAWSLNLSSWNGVEPPRLRTTLPGTMGRIGRVPGSIGRVA